MWGTDFVSPGGEDYLKSLVKPLGLNREMSVLDLSAGPGGPARCVHTASGAWVTGLEANPLLAEHGAARSVKLGLKKQAGVSHYDPHALTIERRFDAIFSKELFFTVQDKRKLFGDIHAGLKPFGQLLFLDYVLEDGNSAPQRWLDREPLEPFPVTAGETKRLLTKARFDVRITEDCTAVQLDQIGVGLAILERHLVSHTLDPDTTRAVKEEVELWVARAEALRHGLKVYRYYALAME
jgi:cyclopropane fatty-acyl-phospholipid synthase-like methyltransferase